MSRTLLCCVVLLLAGCTEESGERPAVRTVEEHVWQDQVDTLDKAREVGDVLEEAAQAQRAQIE